MNVETHHTHRCARPDGLLNAGDALIAEARAQLNADAAQRGQNFGVLFALGVTVYREKQQNSVLVFNAGAVSARVCMFRNQQKSDSYSMFTISQHRCEKWTISYHLQYGAVEKIQDFRWRIHIFRLFTLFFAIKAAECSLY